MFDAFGLSLALVAGQAGGVDVLPPLPRPMTIPSVTPTPSIQVLPPATRRLPTALPTRMQAGQPMTSPDGPGVSSNPPAATYQVPAYEGKASDAAETAEEPEEKTPLMKRLEGTSFGQMLEERSISISGWLQMSANTSSANQFNNPVVWTDRADKFLVQQLWLKVGKAVDTESKEVNFGWQIDALYGTDYRFLISRGLFNEQLQNANGNENLYGFDIPQFYLNAFLPNLFQGTEVRAGRLGTPFGYESIEGANSPLLTRSYSFNFAPPFTHVGVMALPTFSDQWSGKFMLANGNDIFLTSGQELRGVGAITYTAEDKKSTASFGYSLGRGKFNTGKPYNAPTVSLATEPAGRNNINVLDFVYTRDINENLGYGFETIYGWQRGVPSNVPGGLIDNSNPENEANWLGVVNYLKMKHTCDLSSILRVELFEDFRGQRTGFEGLYTSLTYGLQYAIGKNAMFRPEVRYDYNGYSRPFEGKHGIFVLSADLVLRF